MDTRKLFVTEIPLEAKMSECLRTFETFGKISHFEFYPKEGPHAGRAFLEFVDAENGATCYENARHSKKSVSERVLAASGVVVCGTPVVVMIRKGRDELLESRKKVADPRNVDLMFEGRITADMPAADGVLPAELFKRKKLWDRKLDKMNDTNNSVSRTRLAVFNIPDDCGTGRLRKIFAIAPKQYARSHKSEELSKEIEKSQPRLIEVRQPETQKDVAFIEFTKHEHAMGALRAVNNNPKYFEGRRLIVEFAITNSYATKNRRDKEDAKRKKMRTKRFADREPPVKDDNEDSE